MGRKLPENPEALSARDKSILDALANGTSRKALAEQHGVSQERIRQIANTPAAMAYLLSRGASGKALLFVKTGEELLARMDWGGMKLADLLAIWKAAMPQESTVTVNHRIVTEEAERIAAELGMSVEAVLAEAERIVAGAA